MTESGPSPTAEPRRAPKRGRGQGWVVAIAVLGVIVGVIGVILYYGYTTRPGWVGVACKRFWDYLDLLIVPAAIAIGVAILNSMQSERQRNAEDEQKQRELGIEAQRAQDQALQAYLDQLTQLLVTQRDQELIRLQVDDDVRQVVHARSDPLLRALNPTRRWSLVLFLAVMGLLAKGRPLVSLAGADLRGVDGSVAQLKEVDLSGADLSGAELSGAELSGAKLSGANLNGAKLFGADLIGADLENADLRNAELISADLRNAKLQDANLEHAKLEDANLFGAVLHRAKLGHASLRGADLEAAELEDADLSHAVLLPTTLRLNETPSNMTAERWQRSIPGEAYKVLFGGDWKHPLLQTELSSAKLKGANLSDADLRYVNLYDADLQDTVLTRTNLQGATTRVRFVGQMINEPKNEEEQLLKRDYEIHLANVKYGSERARPSWGLVPIEQLKQACSLEGATLPNGSKVSSPPWWRKILRR